MGTRTGNGVLTKELQFIEIVYEISLIKIKKFKFFLFLNFRIYIIKNIKSLNPLVRRCPPFLISFRAISCANLLKYYNSIIISSLYTNSFLSFISNLNFLLFSLYIKFTLFQLVKKSLFN